MSRKKSASTKQLFCALAVACGLLAGCSSSDQAKGLLADYPEPNSLAFDTFAKACSACHRPPLPAKHTAKEWVQVVARMDQHRAERGLAPLAPAVKAEVLAYLQRHAKGGAR